MIQKTFVGIDVGHTGAIGVLYADGGIHAYPMPIQQIGTTKKRNAIDTHRVKEIFEEILSVGGKFQFGMEDAHSMPGEGGMQSFRFGVGIGDIRGILVGIGHKPTMIAPNAWTARMGVPGKQYSNAMIERQRIWTESYPWAAHLIVGPRGGILSGIADALLIAQYMKQMDSPLGKFGGKRPATFRGQDPYRKERGGLFQ